MTDADNPFRLPRHALPRRYDVTLVPDLAAASFTGRVRIELELVEPSTTLVLNAAELTIDSVEVDGVAAAWRSDSETERLTVDVGRTLEPGPAVLTIAFAGVLNDKLRGFYRSTFTDDEGIQRVIATTQMQATDCRRSFPCWDEPDFKAVFGITLVVDGDLLAISNSPEAERSEAAGKLTIRFGDTMVMSSYLVAFVVGPLETTEPIDVNGTPLRLVHLPGKAHLSGFGLDCGRFALDWFERYYGIPYPGEKVDLVALPDFAAGAMENLGCITFRENLLLVDPAAATQAEVETVADVIAHELAHMWFGDLVTMGWWNGIWLNEAFATFMEIMACDAYRPDWQRWVSFGLERTAAFETDSLASTRTVEFEVRSPQDCEGMFDVLTYQKGGALLRMLQQYLGEERFRTGVSHYLAKHAYGNTETGDLWDALEESTGDPARRMMDSWIWQAGYPLITATISGSELILRQQRFGFTEEVTDDPTRWVVPVHVRQSSAGAQQERKVLLEDDEVRLDLLGDAPVVVVNAGGHGFFRVAYDEVLRSRLSGPALAELSTVERYNLVDDAWASVVAGQLAAAEFVEFAAGFGAETDLAVWQALGNALRACARLVDGDALEAFRAQVRRLAGPALDRLGWTPAEGEAELTGKLRGLLIGLVAVLGADQQTATSRGPCSIRRRATRVRSIRNSSRRRRASSPRRVTRPTSIGSSTPSGLQQRRRSSSASSTRWPSSTTLRWSGGRSSSPSPARCGRRTHRS